MAPKKGGIRDARQRIKTAREQCDQAAVHNWPPEEPAECVTKCFYSYENALTAAASALGVGWTKVHPEKAKLAKRLFSEGKLKTDVSDRLVELNALRKDVQYGAPGAALFKADLAELLGELEAFLSEVEAVIQSAEGTRSNRDF